MDRVVYFINVNRDRYIEEMEQDLAIPASALSLNTEATSARRAAEWTAGRVKTSAQITPLKETPGHPVVYGDGWTPGKPTVLFYGHYDVQPADPLRPVDVAAFRSDDSRRQPVRARGRRRQRPDVHALQGVEAP